jgi:K+-sensing histidine kinase KdpD
VGAKHSGGSAHDLDAARLGAFRTAVRKVNHCSILTGSGRRSRHKGTVGFRPVGGRTYNRSVRALKYVAAALTVAPIVLMLRLAAVSYAGVAAPLLLLDVVVAARLWGTGPALGAAAVASGAYSYFFLPPAGFGIEDPEDWIAFITFIVTAVIAGELASRAERRAAEAQAGRAEIERLYQELQAAFERASEAEAARRNEQLKSALLDALTHNLRTPLTSIKAAVTALIGAGVWHPSSELSGEGRKELLQVIDEESDRLNRFIEGLSTSDSAEPAPPIHLRAVNVADVVQSGLQRAETVTRDHHVVVHVDDQVPAVSADAASITEVIYILLDNASKYAPPGTTITVDATAADDQLVRIRVCDEGPGIDPELRERVFEKFFRVPARESHDPNRGGIGLGLPIARRLVETQAGQIAIETPPSGRGAAVVITLPAAVDAASVDRQAPMVAVSR